VSALVTNYLGDREDGETFTTWVLRADETLVRGDKVLETVTA
jgi:sulfite reductase (ferredoxin)